MNETSRENLSAFCDGELAFDQVRFMLRQMDHSAQLRASWSSYHMYRDCMRGEFSGSVSDGFAERVMSALETSTAATAHSGRRRWLQWSAGGAIAASVAAVALMVAQPRGPSGVPASSGHVIAAAASRNAAAPAATPVTRAPEVPRWLTASAAGQYTQPAAASTFDGHVLGNNALIPAAYSRHMAPYMSLRGYQASSASMARQAPAGGWISASPEAANQPAASRRAH